MTAKPRPKLGSPCQPHATKRAASNRPLSSILSATSLSRGQFVRLAGCDLSQQLVRLLLFLKGLGEESCRVLHAQLLGPSDESSVAGHFVMLDSLAGGNEARIDRFAFPEILDCLVTFRDDPLDRLAGLGLRPLTDNLEDLLETFDMSLGLLAMREKCLLQLHDF